MINTRRMLLVALDIIVAMESFVLWGIWEFGRTNNRSCGTPGYIFCNDTPSWLMMAELTAIIAFIAAAIAFSIYGFRRLEHQPDSTNIGIWVVLGLSILPVIYFWYPSF